MSALGPLLVVVRRLADLRNRGLVGQLAEELEARRLAHMHNVLLLDASPRKDAG